MIHRKIYGSVRMEKYEIIIWWSKEDTCYLAEVPELPGCMADGETLSEVTEAVNESIRLWIEVNKDRGIEIPEPKGRLMFA
jgi:predicted RNase H-like HicB family nuclease